MSDRCRARVIRVKRDKHGAVLASAAAIGDTVLLVKDAGDLAFDDEVAGTLLVDDDAATQLTYTDVEYVEDTDQGDLTSPDTVTLSAALTVAIAADTQLWVYEEPEDPDDDGVVSDYTAICVPEDDEDAAELGGRLHATIPPDKLDDLPVGKQPGRGVPVVLEYDDDTDEWTVYRFRGSARGIRFETNDSYTVTAADVTAGTVTFPLSQRPVSESIKLWWRATFQPPTEYTVNEFAQTVTMPLGSFVSAGDVIYVHYAYRKGIVKEPPAPINFTVVGTPNMQHGVTTTSLAFPAGTQAGDLFLYAATARSAATNTCADSRATLWADQTLGLDTVRIWRGKVSNPSTPLTVNITDLGGVQECAFGLIVIRPEKPADWDASKLADSGAQSAGVGSVPALSGVSGAIGVGFTNAGIGGTEFYSWPAPWTNVLFNGNYAKVSFAVEVASTVAATPSFTTADIWRGFAAGVGLA